MASGIAIANINLDELGPEWCDWCLPTTNYYNGPYIFVKNEVNINAIREVTEVSPEEVLRETFRRTGRTNVCARIKTTDPNSMEYWWDMGWVPDGKLVVPDKLRWGELVQWCHQQSDFGQTNFCPIGTAPEEQIIAYLDKNFAQQKRR